VAGQRGVEDHFADRLALGAKSRSLDDGAIGEHEQGGRLARDPGSSVSGPVGHRMLQFGRLRRMSSPLKIRTSGAISASRFRQADYSAPWSPFACPGKARTIGEGSDTVNGLAKTAGPM